MTGSAAGRIDGAPIAIGVTGHRPPRLADVDLAALRRRIDAVLGAIAAAAPHAAFRLVGSLAEGADTILADAAAARGWRVDAVLPFPRADYARDFAAPDAAAAFARHLAAAGSVFEAPGHRDEPGGAAAAYERAGRIVLAQSDLVLAVWDGAAAAGRGGTAQIVAEAVQQGLPVLIIDPRADGEDDQLVLLWHGLGAPAGAPSVETVARGDLSALAGLMATLVPGDERATAGSAMEAREAEPLRSRIEAADRVAARAMRLSRGALASVHALAALTLALVAALTLSRLPVPAALWPPSAFAAIGTLWALIHTTRQAERRRQHWRQLAERWRCLDLSASLGDLMLHDRGRLAGLERKARASGRRPARIDESVRKRGEMRVAARSLGLPSAVADKTYLAAVHRRLLDLLDDRIAYRTHAAAQLRRFARPGGTLLIMAAITCASLFALGAPMILPPQASNHHPPHASWQWLLAGAGLLAALAAAIQAVRLHGELVTAAKQEIASATRLGTIHAAARADPPTFDMLLELVRQTANMLADDPEG